jgi:hypothetical protein
MHKVIKNKTFTLKMSPMAAKLQTLQNPLGQTLLISLV